MTAADFFAMAEGPPYFQLIDGDLYMSPSPRWYHQKLALRFAQVLQNYLDQNPLGELNLAPSDVMFDEETVLNPDLYFVSNERAYILTTQGAEGAPDLVVEILSPSTARLDVGRKREIYANSGVIEMWVIAPDTKTAEIYRFAEHRSEPVSIFRPGGTLTSALFPNLEIPLDALFRKPGAPAS